MTTLLLVLVLGCAQPAPTACDVICDSLVIDCAFDAYPSRDSCMQGCAYKEDQGARVKGEAACIQTAACDTFAIIECENKYGVPDEE